MKLLKFLTNQYFWLAVIVIVGFGVRLYEIDNPIADWHSWRQADTAAVARNFYKQSLPSPDGEVREGFNPLFPKGDDMSPVGKDNPNLRRLRFVEFPIYNSLVYFLYLLNGGVDERLARMVSIFMSLGSIIFIYLIVKRHWDNFTALVSSFVFAVLPFNIYFSRVILPEPTLVFFSLGMFYLTDLWIHKNSFKLFFLSSIFAAGAFLIKPMAIFYLLPLVFSFWQKEGRIWPIPKRYFLWGAISFLPFVAWRFWISQYPDGIPASSWLFNGNGIRLRPSFWKWIIGDRFGREILTVAGSILFTLGAIVKPNLKEGNLLHWFLASSLLYLIVFATGNVMHDYYQTFIIPALAIFTARGFVLLVRGTKDFLPRLITIPVAVLLLSLTIYLGWLEVKGLFQVNNGAIVEAGKFADSILPEDAIVIAPYGGDTAFLYQINRPGWAMVVSSIEEMKKKSGVTHYISVNYDADTKNVIDRYSVIEENPRFVIVDVTQENPKYKSLPQTD
ncbi:phospholipid carrier-dependent glycosyltransferase [Candidatus Parcubacteria bacterium]|nr:MAG: phospholipid carrier-dependent glycosyltransferase [Candidatus Parcubacteria bacterium]